MIQTLKNKKCLQIEGMLFHDNLKNYRLLSEKGLMDHGPVTRYYDFHCKYGAPMAHQVTTVDFMCRHQRGFVFNGIGTGKTLCMDWYYDFLRSEGKAQRALIIAPLSTLQSVHAKELKWSLPHLRHVILHGSKQRRLDELNKDAHVYIINFDGFLAKWVTNEKTHKLEPHNRELLDALARRPDINCIFIDETAVIRNTGTHAWRNINYLFGVHRKDITVWGFTGSPTPKAPTDAYAQAKLINPDMLPQQYDHRSKKMRPVSHKKFQSLTMRPVGEWGWEPLKGWEATCAKTLQPSIRFTRKQVEKDLPPVVVQTLKIEMTKGQKQAYNQMLKEFRVELRNGKTITAVHEGAKLLKLNQICCGAVYDDDRKIQRIDCSLRINELLRIKSQSDNHLLISIPFKNMATHLKTELSKQHKVGVITGQTGLGARTDLIRDFSHGDLDILISTPGSIPYGINLQHKCSTVVWWGPINRYDHYEQFNGRTDRKGQTRKVLIVHLESAPVQREMYRKLKRKEDAQKILLQILKERA